MNINVFACWAPYMKLWLAIPQIVPYNFLEGASTNQATTSFIHKLLCNVQVANIVCYNADLICPPGQAQNVKSQVVSLLTNLVIMMGTDMLDWWQYQT